MLVKKTNYELRLGDSAVMLPELPDSSVHAVVTDPPYGIHVLGNDWDKILPSQSIWDHCFRILKPGAFLISFGHARFYHRMAVQLETAGFVIRDCLCWGYATSNPRPHNADKAVDRYLNIDVDYNQFPYEPKTEEGQKWKGFANVLKTAWEPIVLAQKPLEGSLAENLINWKVGALNIDACRIPYASNADKKALESFLHFAKTDHGDKRYFSANADGKKMVNVHPDGRWPGNLLWLDPLFAEYDHIFMIPKPNKNEKRSYNEHDTVKPVWLMRHLIQLITPKPSMVKETVCVVDPFMGTGTTGVACKYLGRKFLGYEIDQQSYDIAVQRITEKIGKPGTMDIFAS
jgi:site-specific DNA-methyltransferase (adenine-specific)